MHPVRPLSRLIPAALAAVLLAPGGAAAQDPSEPCEPYVDFDTRSFGHDSTVIDNRYLPLEPGVRLVLEGRANRGGGVLPHRVSFTVTDVVKEIDGVRTLAVWDVDVNEDVLVEEELAFWAQDEDGNVWNLGEYPEEFQDGVFAGAPSVWLSGLEGATGGVHMPGRPRVGDDYLQGDAPAVDFLDCATVIEDTGQRLVTRERSPLDEAGGFQTKTHARGVGIVEVAAIDDPEGETLVLVERRRLPFDERQAACEAALRLDRRAYHNAPVYRQTPPAYGPIDGGCRARPDDDDDEPRHDDEPGHHDDNDDKADDKPRHHDDDEDDHDKDDGDKDNSRHHDHDDHDDDEDDGDKDKSRHHDDDEDDRRGEAHDDDDD